MLCTVSGAGDTEVNKTTPAYSHNNNFLIGGTTEECRNSLGNTKYCKENSVVLKNY